MRLFCLLSLFVVMVLGLVLVGCGGGGGGGDGSSSPVRVTFSQPLTRTVTSGALVTLEVQTQVTSGSGSIARVDYTVNGSEIGSAVVAPYRLTWNTAGLAAGAYEITAIAYDNSNPARTGAASISLTVLGSPVVVAFTAPGASGRVVDQGATVTLSATASAPAGIARVQFSANGSVIGTATTATGGVYSVNWNTSGRDLDLYDIVATAYDRAAPAHLASAAIQIQVKAPALPVPTVAIDSPTAGASVTWNMYVNVRAQAQAAGARITRIDVTFGSLSRVVAGNGTAAASGTVAFDTTAIADGNHDITAIATDTNGRQASATVTVKVANAISPPPPPF